MPAAFPYCGGFDTPLGAGEVLSRAAVTPPAPALTAQETAEAGDAMAHDGVLPETLVMLVEA